MVKKDNVEHLRGPIAWMAGNSVAANLLMLLFVLGGIFFYLQSTKEVFPEFALDQISITVPYPGASPEEVEQGIVLPLEDAINEVEGLGEINSIANEGSGRVTAEVLDTGELIRISQDIKSAVDRITFLPDESEEPVVAIDARRRSVLRLAVYGPADELVLREAADLIVDSFLQSNEIGPVELSGARDYEVQVEVSQDDLRRYKLSLSDIANHIRTTSLELPGGVLETRGGDLLVRLQERREFAKDYATIPVITTESGSKVLLGDIAKVKDGFEDTNNFVTFDGKPAVMLEVFRVGSQSPISVSDAVRYEIENIKRILPADIQIAITSDSSEVFSQRAELLIKNGLWGFLLVIILLALFLDMRLALWVSIGIPISFAGAFLFFPFTDFTINMITMFAFIISLGIVVDDAIVVGENVYTYREQGYGALEASIKGAQEVALPVTFSILTNIAAFLPFFFIEGFMGKVFAAIPVVVVSVFIVSLIESLFVLPEHLHFKRESEIKTNAFRYLVHMQNGFNKRFQTFVNVHYRQWIERLIERRYLTLISAISVLLVVLAFIASGRMGMQLFPRVESDSAYANITFPPGTPDQQLQEIQILLEAAANRVIDTNGNGELSEGIFTSIRDNRIESYVMLTDPEVRPISTSEFSRQWREAMGPVPGAETVSFVSDRGGPGSGAALTVELSHRNIRTLEHASVELAAILADFPNTKDIDDGTAQGKRQFDFSVNNIGQALGLTPADIASQTRAAFQGIEAIKQQRGRNEVTVRVRYPENERSSQQNFEDLIIRTASGTEVLLRDVVNIDEGRAYTTINRRDGRRIIQVQADVDPPEQSNQIISSIVKDGLPALQQRYPGLSYSFEGRQADIRESMIGLFYGLAGVLVLIYGLLAMLFRSYLQPLMVMVAIPFSVIGVVIGHLLMGYSLSVMTVFGFVALTGVVVNDSLVLIDFANRHHVSGEKVEDAICNAAIKRFRPIILTTVTTFAGMAPMIFESSRQARFMIPMAISLGFGILFATVVTLGLTPVLYVIIRDAKELMSKFFGAIGKSIRVKLESI
ncbi:MAG: efflux RND transporter permease subunit [Gammaproteobacteria bacterium]|nr:efflux RND transporter permease subunit [Gammaproteobacteria bacterium]